MKTFIWLLLSLLLGLPATTDYNNAPPSDIPLPSPSAAAPSAAPTGPPAPSPSPSAKPSVGGIVKEEVISSSPDVRKLTFKSNALGKDKRFNIYLPPGYSSGSDAYPVLYMIHGTGNNENQWMPDLGLDTAADKLIGENRIRPLIIVTPQIDSSYGLNSEEKGLYSDYLTQDLVSFVDKHFRTLPSREDRYIGGLSMGGFAALNNAFRHPELFSKVGGHSPALWMDYWADTGDLQAWLYPDEETRKARDPLSLAETADFEDLTVFLDSGKHDGYRFYEGSELLYNKLLEKGIQVEYHLWDGEHTKNYWSSHTEDYLMFFASP
ncbi:alpha/beta hydrolase-fold protein [Paenibacillus sp. YN15]|uniref:alpha/beta hydrolase n=1 Tax=Paenibacillus sp. YN15 TaxID=1742774 RepID=UPI0026A1C5DA|nr:alpha/beta hydrolase-fold protein [Paenibacillus sp. YN15]